MRKIICIIAGDPNSINSELVFKSWKNLSLNIRKKIVLIGNYELIKKEKKKLRFNVTLSKITNIEHIKSNNTLKVLDLPLKFKNCFSVPKRRPRNM